MTKNKLQKLTSLGVASVLLGSVLAPVVASAATTNDDNDIVTANVSSVITMTTSGNVSFTIVPDADGNISSASDTVAVSTNNLAGYTLTLQNASESTTLVSAANDTFAAASSTPGALGVGEWGFAVGGLSGFDGSLGAQLLNQNSSQKYAGVPALGSPRTIKTTAEELQSDQTVVRYAANADSTQPQGAYQATVVYTATTN